MTDAKRPTSRRRSRGKLLVSPRTRSARVAGALKDNQARCPVCRNGAYTTPYGYLRKHRDLFGHPCYNRRPPEVTP